MLNGQADDGLAEAARRIEENCREGVDYLDLSGLNLTELPQNIDKLKSVQHLDLSNNQFADFPNAVFALRELEHLDLSQNELTLLPESITRLYKLERLNLGGNPLKVLPQCIGDLARLQELRVYDTEATYLPHTISSCQRLQFLDLHGNWLSGLPDSLGALTHVTTLNLANNRLRVLPKTIGNIVRLNHLDISDNELSQIYDICTLKQLSVLYLKRNQIDLIPPAIVNLSRLSTLSLANNNLHHIPDYIDKLHRLRALYLDRNQITRIPDTLGNLTALEELYINNNKLVSLPQSVGRLTSLRTLNVAENQLQDLPDSLRNLSSSLHTFTIAPNPCALSLPAEILAKGTPSEIIDLYFTADEQCEPLNEAKVVFVGYEGVGKTSLLDCVLLGKPFIKDRPPTEGVKITTHDIVLPKGDQAILRIWDFGGQEIYHAMHGIFLTERALYLLVVNGRREREIERDAEDWLELIKRFASKSPVIVILNKFTSSPFTINRQALKDKYGDIRFVETDCDDGTGFSPLRELIRDEVDALDGLRDRVPASWLAVRSELLSRKEGYIGFDTFRKICSDCGEHDTESQEKLARHLHKLGIALSYRDDQRLQDLHVLQPEWVTRGISAILSARKSEVRLRELSRLLDHEYSGNTVSFLLELMRKFGLCFRLDSSIDNANDDGYLIPELLSSDEHPETRDFSPKECLNFEYRYLTPMPAGLLPNFIVRTYVLSNGKPRWRSGVILALDSNEALVKSDPADRRVMISAKGHLKEGRRSLIRVIRFYFDDIHKAFKLPVEARVPIPGNPDVSIPYELLVMCEKQRRPTHPVAINGKLEDINVKTLLNEIDPPRDESIFIKPKSVFISYASKDEMYKDELRAHLALMQQDNRIKPWDDRQIGGGEEWERRIWENLQQSDIVLPLISPDYNSSEFCKREIDMALQRHYNGEARVMPILVRDCDWQEAPFSRLQILARAKAIASYSSKPRRDRAWANVTREIKKTVEQLEATEKT